MRLVQRRPDGYATAPAGEEMRDLAVQLRGSVNSLEHRPAEPDVRPAGSVRIATADTLAVHLLSSLVSPLVAATHKADPDIASIWWWRTNSYR